jgi:Carboxypeptidase regulatory-like domain
MLLIRSTAAVPPRRWPIQGTVVRLLSLVLTSGIGALYAQNSQISGRILDPSQAGIDSAVATLTRVDTGDRRETVSTAEGYYSFPLLATFRRKIPDVSPVF